MSDESQDRRPMPQPEEHTVVTVDPPASDPYEARDAKAAGRRVFPLGQRLHAINRHPVLMFGTTSSGKSTILMSFIANLMQNPDVSITLGEPIYPAGHERRDEAHRFALEFFERRAQDFIYGRSMLRTTEIPYPMFLPIDIQRSRDPLPVKFAFLEGKGEWYEPSAAARGSLYQELRDEVADVLKFYDSPLSGIFVAPCSDMDDVQRLRENDTGLMGALNAYRRYRMRRDDDSLLFLLTKWDIQANPINNPKFGHLDGAEVSGVLDTQYPDSWRAFQAMPRPLRNDHRFFMQYCAGYLVEEANRPPPMAKKAIFDRYPRTLLNWLYGNGTRISIGSSGRTRENVLFDDVVVRNTLQIRYLERVTNLIFAR
jgi:hypothetical protein